MIAHTCIILVSSWKQDLLEDPAIISAIDEETEFNALVVSKLPFILKT